MVAPQYEKMKYIFREKGQNICNLCDKQMEVNKKREAELHRLRRELDESSLQSESMAASLRKRHGEVVSELSEQCEALQRTRVKLEKEKQNLRMEMDDLSASVDSLQKAKVRKLAEQATRLLCYFN